MKKLLSIILVLVLVLSVAACGAKETPAPAVTPEEPAATDEQAPTEEEKVTDLSGQVVGFSVSTLNNPYFVTLTEAAQVKAKELGLELVVVDAGDDVVKQASDVEDLVSKNVAVLIVNPVDSDAITSSIQDVVDKGIPVVAVDRAVNGVDIATQIASDNVAGGKLAGEYMLELLGEGAKVAELEGIPGASSTNERGGGFNEVIAGKLEVVAKQTANYNRVEGLNVTENILQSNPDIQGIFAHNDEMALGALEAATGKELVIIGFDATDDALSAISAGTMTATIAQKPGLMGEVAVETAIKIINKEAVEKTIPVDVELIKK